MSLRHAELPQSVVSVVYEDAETAPPWQARRLERALGSLFPNGTGVVVSVNLAWSDERAAWAVRRAVVDLGSETMDATFGLRRSLVAAGLPIVS